MARAVYSTQLYAAVFTGTGASVTHYTVPVGYRTVLKSLFIVPVLAGGTLIPTVNLSISLGLYSVTTNGQPIQLAPNIVLNAGDTLDFYAPTGQVYSILASGYELTL